MVKLSIKNYPPLGPFPGELGAQILIILKSVQHKFTSKFHPNQPQLFDISCTHKQTNKQISYFVFDNFFEEKK